MGFVDIERVGNRIHLRTAWAPDVPALCKSVSGASWAKSKKAWTYPLDWSTCLELRRVWGERLRVGVELATWAREAKKSAERIRALGEADSADLVRLGASAPQLDAALATRPYQQVGAAYVAAGRRVLIGDEPGMGKTLETIAGIIEAGIVGPILVFAPKTAVQSVWEKEIKKWDPDGDLVFAAVGSKEQRQHIINTALFNAGMHNTRRVWVIGNIEMARVWIGDECPTENCLADKAKSRQDKDIAANCPYGDDKAKEMFGDHAHAEVREFQYPELFTHDQLPWSAIVVDELHRALICHAAVLKKMTQQRAGMALLPLAPNGLKLALSGTPWRGKPKNFWGTLNWLRPDVYTSYWRWAEKWFEIVDTGYSRDVCGLKEELEDEFTADMRAVMLRRTKQECMPELPRKMYPGAEEGGIWLEMLPAQAKSYASMVRDAAMRFEEGTVMATGVLAEFTRLRQLAVSAGRAEVEPSPQARGITLAAWRKRNPDADVEVYYSPKTLFKPSLPSNKFDWIIEFLSERGIEKEEPWGEAKVVIASQWTEIIELFADALRSAGIECHTLTGKTSSKDRVRIIEEFQSEGGPRVFLLNTKAGGVAVTLDAADDLIFLDETWIPDDQEQVEDRIHRASRIHQVSIWYIRSSGTIEETIAAQNLSLEEIQKNLMDGSRGVDFARKLLEV